ncbi:MAG TPA: hypothetical protein VHJ00_10610, partial [Bradyrhizobium sp.]|nr:hypothetical protein [Bradyrhizobium sp.]
MLERMEARLAARPAILKQRREIAEHPFGSIKQWMEPEYLSPARAGEGTGRIQPDGAGLQFIRVVTSWAS